jgi:hypothetical protein
MTFLWTNRAISELKRICDLGWRCRAIAKELGDECTKGMVIGKARRLREKGWTQMSTVSPPAYKLGAAISVIEKNYAHTCLYCNDDCKEGKPFEITPPRRKGASSLRQPQHAQPKLHPALEVLFPSIKMLSRPPLDEAAPILCEICNLTAIPDYPRCKWPGTDIRKPPRFECPNACVFGKPYCYEHWVMSVVMSKRAFTRRSNMRPRSGGIWQLRGGVKPSHF